MLPRREVTTAMVGLCSALFAANVLAQTTNTRVPPAAAPISARDAAVTSALLVTTVTPVTPVTSSAPIVADNAPSQASHDNPDVAVVAPSPGPERLDVGAAVNSQDGLIGSAYFGKNNLIPGIYTFATVRYARQAQIAQVGMFKPNAFGHGIDAGVDINFLRDAYKDQGFDTTTYGVEPYVRFPIGHTGVLTTGVGYRVQTLDAFAADAPLSFREDAGTRSGLYLRLSSSFDKFVETDRLTLSATLDNHLYNLTSKSDALWQSEGRLHSTFAIVPNQVSLLNTVRIGAMGALGGASPSVADRFFIGGEDLRGFAPRRVGTRDGSYFAGGERYATASVDVVKKMGVVLNTPVSVGVFADMGALWGAHTSLDTANNAHPSVRASIGIAVTFSVAGIPVSAYIAKPVVKAENDVDQIVGVAVSTRF